MSKQKKLKKNLQTMKIMIKFAILFVTKQP